MKSEARLVDSLKISSLSFGILLSPPTTRAFWCHNLVVGENPKGKKEIWESREMS